MALCLALRQIIQVFAFLAFPVECVLLTIWYFHFLAAVVYEEEVLFLIAEETVVVAAEKAVLEALLGEGKQEKMC